MNFETDIFISYAHIDNQPLIPKQEGWISEFHRALESRVSHLRGKKPRIWRDPKLQGNDYFGDEIVQQFPKVAVLVSIFSPRYIKSEWCIKELKTFCQGAEKSGGIRVAGDKSRIFKVIKTPVPREQHPEEVQSILGYEFYELDETGRPHEFNRAFGKEYEMKFLIQIDELAFHICELLEVLEGE